MNKPRQHTIAFECVGHEQITLSETASAHLDIRMLCSSRHGCPRSGQQAMSFESIPSEYRVNEVAFSLEATQRIALQLRPRRGAKTVKMHTISRAEGGQLQPPMRQSACQYGRNSHHSGRSMGVPEQAPVGRHRRVLVSSRNNSKGRSVALLLSVRHICRNINSITLADRCPSLQIREACRPRHQHLLRVAQTSSRAKAKMADRIQAD